ncbi:hypothetical protein PGT21_022433 [Puccinia graminis f. sp. tritici]|uniref:Velvet domain-containing protein n=1 Tax=Puccinia graminis f. sp. tritici TaxID=56615 RepID=A0A5B0RLC4_PUCGR|nr:hypothetical protein PGT21_022433 [Puccinia graminis f. sp. tritici]KAA1125743.1 hypothetical protein PGTUg99_012004 [Puccinia graminis f. sp. tritici]
MANEFPRFNILQHLARGIRLDEGRFPGGTGQTPVMPCLVARGEVPDGFDTNSVSFEQYECTLQLYDSTGAVRLPDTLMFRLQPVRCQFVPSMEDPNQIDPLFVFQEIMIRDCGVFRLRVILYEIGQTRVIATTMTDPFDIVEYSEFPGGARIWTPLSQHLRAHGIVLHLPPDNDSINWDEEYPTTNGIL